MSEYNTFRDFTKCTKLIDFQNSANTATYHKMNLEWILPSTNVYQYDKIEIYRYIGPYMSCVDPYTITDATPSKLIYTVQQIYNSVNELAGSSTITRYFPTASSVTVNSNLLGITSTFTDDFTSLLQLSYDLSNFHNLETLQNNQTVINDIGFTRRVLYYILKPYIRVGST